jgi:circadian clock protein KaiB
MTDPVWPIHDSDAATPWPLSWYRFRLFISGATPRSLQAVRNIKMIGERYLGNQYELEVIDAYQQVDLAQEQDIVALPTLIKHFPLPVRRIIGDLSDTQHVLQGLALWPIG